MNNKYSNKKSNDILELEAKCAELLEEAGLSNAVVDISLGLGMIKRLSGTIKAIYGSREFSVTFGDVSLRPLSHKTVEKICQAMTRTISQSASVETKYALKETVEVLNSEGIDSIKTENESLELTRGKFVIAFECEGAIISATYFVIETE